MKKRLILFSVMITVITVLISIPAFAAGEAEKDIICIARDGECVSYPAYSAAAIKEAKNIGADAVSIGVCKTSDGILVTLRNDDLAQTFPGVTGKSSETDFKTLSGYCLRGFDGEKTEYTVSTLEQALKEEIPLVIDGWEYRNEIADIVKKYGAEARVKLRARADAKEMLQWSSETGIDVIGIYYGNIVFFAIKHIRAFSADGSWIQLQSGNYFSVLFNRFVMKRFDGGAFRAVCAAYEPDYCGQRTDSSQGFDDIIARGYSVLETNRPKTLVEYKDRLSERKAELETLKNSAVKAVEGGEYSSSCVEKVNAAVSLCDKVLEKHSSVLEIEEAQAALISAVKSLSPPDGAEPQRDVLNVTPGKIAAVIIFGSAVVAAQIYVYKKKRK